MVERFPNAAKVSVTDDGEVVALASEDALPDGALPNARFPNASPIAAEGRDDKTDADKGIHYGSTKAKKPKNPKPTITDSVHLLRLTDETIAAAVEGEGKTAMVVFVVPWCTPCKQVMPMLASLANEFAGKATLAVADVETAKASVAALKIKSVPTFVIFYGGAEVSRFSSGNFSATKAKKAIKHAFEVERLAGEEAASLPPPPPIEWVPLADASEAESVEHDA